MPQVALPVFIRGEWEMLAARDGNVVESGAELLECRRLYQLQCQSRSCHDHIDVPLIGKVIRVDQRRVERVAGFQADNTFALWPQT
jgi:hypothetical protein